MECMEIILLRTSFPHEACKHMKKFCRIIKKYNLSNAIVYAHSSIPGDLALIISSKNEHSEKENGTCWGIYMADVLKQFGLVDYNCWKIIK